MKPGDSVALVELPSAAIIGKDGARRLFAGRLGRISELFGEIALVKFGQHGRIGCAGSRRPCTALIPLRFLRPDRRVTVDYG